MEPIPLIIYGGAGAVGSFAIKLAQVSNIHPLIVMAGNSIDYVESLVRKEKVTLSSIIA
jgi:NADPH2:quinone reductase